MDTLIVIPARYASTRFPGKPLALLGGKPIIQCVWERVSQLDAHVVVATDDTRILNTVRNFGGNAMMTKSSHRSGTDRCGEVLQALDVTGKHYSIIVNVQGDEPFVEPSQIQSLIDCFDNPKVEIATIKKRIHTNDELLSPNNVKVITNLEGKAIYFSRQVLPHLRGIPTAEWLCHQSYYKHIGIYAFRADTLRAIVKLPQSPLEISESLEQLRWIENNRSIFVAETQIENIGIDTPEDLALAQQFLNN